MTTVLFADRDGAAFGPLGERTIPALLPIQAEPALERALKALVAAGRRSALLVVGPRAREVEARFGKGIRWGIALEYVRREDGESVGDVLRRLEPRLDGDTLVVRGDVGAEGSLGEFLSAAATRDEAVLAGAFGSRPAGFWRLAPAALKKAALPRDPADADWAIAPDHAPVPLDGDAPLLDSVASYRRLDRSEKPAVSPRADVHPKARLGAGTTVAEEAVVLAGAELADVTVLPRTVIPAGVSLVDAVVSGNLVTDAASGATSLLTDLLPEPRAKAPAGPGLGSRLAGVAALVLSLPLWPVAFFWSLLANAGHATGKVTLNANGSEGGARAPLETFRFETAVPVFRDLPLLAALAGGRLALTGVAPLGPGEEGALAAGWERVRLEAPVGLLSLARLVVPASAPAEVARLVDAFEARRPSSGLVSLALANLFSAKGWTAPKAWNPDVVEVTE